MHVVAEIFRRSCNNTLPTDVNRSTIAGAANTEFSSALSRITIPRGVLAGSRYRPRRPRKKVMLHSLRSSAMPTAFD